MNNIDIFYATVKTKMELSGEFRKEFGKILAPDFNFFDFWYIDENKVSEIIAHFLNPNETHNQNDTFLQLFISHFDLDFKYTDHDRITVECEHVIDNRRRIDIVIRKNEKEQIIAIENKIYLWTADQNNQIIDYIDYLKRVTNDNYCLLYLSPSGKTISETSLSKVDFEHYSNLSKLKLISYEENIIELIHLFAIHSESERVRHFLLEFEKKLKEQFIGENYMDESKMITNYILESQDNLKTSLNIAVSLNNAKDLLLEKFKLQLEQVAADLGIKYDSKTMHFYPSNWSKHTIGLSYESGALLYGIKRNEESKGKIPAPEIEKLFKEKFQVSYWWSMHRDLYSNINNNAEFWLEINSGEAKEKIKDFVEKVNTHFNTTEY